MESELMVEPTSNDPGKVDAGRRCYVFVNRGFPVGGIETLVLRLTDLLMKDGSAVVVCGRPSPLSALLPEGVRFFESVDDIRMAHVLSGYLKRNFAGFEITLVSLHPWALVNCLVMRYFLHARGVRNTRAFHMVTSSRAFFFSESKRANDFLERVFFASPRESTVFMNDAALLAHAAYWGKDLSDYPVLRIPVGGTDVAWKPVRKTTFRIVSVGRLVPFKAYNRSAPSIVRRLLDSGYSVEWDIWGDGEDTDNVLEEIKKHRVEDAVRLRGVLPYEELHSTIAEYDAFVGMGTAILEAAQTGMPSICALDLAGDQSYGFLFETPLDSVGDAVEGHEPHPVYDKVRQLIHADEDEQRLIGQKCLASVHDRSDGLTTFADAIIQSRLWPVRWDFESTALFVKSVLLLGVREIYLRWKLPEASK